MIVGARIRAAPRPRSRSNAKGISAGSTSRGQRLWIFHTIPQPGEFGNETWENDSWSYSGNAGMWGPFSVDEELETVYMPIELSTGDYYGGHRPGNNLFTESLVAVDLHTGKRKWHFQFVHHGIWDFDLPCAPILADVRVDGKPVKAVAVPSKQGDPVCLRSTERAANMAIVERPVEKGTVPGECITDAAFDKPPRSSAGCSGERSDDFTPELLAERRRWPQRSCRVHPAATRGERQDRDGVNRKCAKGRGLVRSG